MYVFIFCELRGDKRQDDTEMKFTLTLPIRVEAGMRDGSPSLFCMTLFNPKKDTLKVLYCYLFYK